MWSVNISGCSCGCRRIFGLSHRVATRVTQNDRQKVELPFAMGAWLVGWGCETCEIFGPLEGFGGETSDLPLHLAGGGPALGAG
jgi:hypothetical protein